jgi:hypothetical protein
VVVVATRAATRKRRERETEMKKEIGQWNWSWVGVYCPPLPRAERQRQLHRAPVRCDPGR